MASIIVIDDDRLVRSAILTILEDHGYTGFTASDGLEAEEILLQHAIDVELVITDIFMPNQDGLETIIGIKRRWPAIKIIAISGAHHRDIPNYLCHARVLGAAQILTKPFSASELLAAVHSCLRPGNACNDSANPGPGPGELACGLSREMMVAAP